MKRIVVIIVCLLMPLLSMSADFAALWKSGTNAYLQKQYDSAAYYFEQVAASKPHNAELYYNLGNVYYRLNRIPQAVLNYRRALRIEPSYTDASDNLAVAEARISHHIAPAEDIFFISWWKNTTSETNETSWAIAALIVFALMMGVIWLRYYGGAARWLPFQLPGILGFVCAVFLVFASVAAGRSSSSSGAVVMENDAALMNSDLKGKPLALIPEGTTVKTGEERGMWVEVTLPDGRSGYVLTAQVTRI